MTKILLADDDLALSDVVAFTLRRAGFDIVRAYDGRQALEIYRRELPDLIVLDWMMPYLNGIQVCSRIRADSNVPIVMLTVLNTDDEVITALEAGADEYITKPFSPRQLIARIQALLRRAGTESVETLRAGSISLNVERHELYWDQRGLFHLTPLETRLLQALIQNAGNVMTNEGLTLRVWGPEGATNEMLKQLVYRLRVKLEPDPNSPSLIETVPNSGYSLRPPG